MYRLFFILFIFLGFYTAFAVADDPSSPKAQEGKAVYLPINPLINVSEEQKIQQDDQNMTGQAKAK